MVPLEPFSVPGSIGQISEICVAGASHRGISYIGCFKRLEELGLMSPKSLKKVIGISIGSFISFCYISGYPIDELIDFILDTEFSLFKDISLCDSAILKGTIFRKWVYDCMADCNHAGPSGAIEPCKGPNITMIDFYKLTGVDFTVIATCLETGITHFNYKTHPNVRVYDALVASMALPFVFPPYVIDGLHYIDGGTLDNFPLHMLSRRGLGIIASRHGPDLAPTWTLESNTGPFKYMDKVLSCISRHIRSLSKEPDCMVVCVSSDDSIINLDINADDKITLYMRGYDSVSESETIKRLIHMYRYDTVVTEINGMHKNIKYVNDH